MKHTIPILTALLLSPLVVLYAADTKPQPDFYKLAITPPMGWNSYDNYGFSVTEAEILTNAVYMKEKLLPYGWNICVVDFRWADPGDHRYGRKMVMDEFGRLIPATNRFPSAAGGKGFKELADKVHAMGLKFGIHMMRGIHKDAVAQNTPIEGSSYHAVDAADTNSTCACTLAGSSRTCRARASSRWPTGPACRRGRCSSSSPLRHGTTR